MSKKGNSFVIEPERSIPIFAEADVVVVGGGPGGVPAAVAAARKGAEVLIIEHYGFLGGLASAGMIGPLFGYNTAQTGDLMLGGIPVEVVEELQALGGAPQPKDIQWKGIPFEPDLARIITTLFFIFYPDNLLKITYIIRSSISSLILFLLIHK